MIGSNEKTRLAWSSTSLEDSSIEIVSNKERGSILRKLYIKNQEWLSMSQHERDSQASQPGCGYYSTDTRTSIILKPKLLYQHWDDNVTWAFFRLGPGSFRNRHDSFS